jgi:hypothetical protein
MIHPWSINELKTVPDKLVVEDKYVVDYPIDELKTEPKLKLKSNTVIMKILLTPLMIISYQ